MAEWLKVSVLKSEVYKYTVGSNPTFPILFWENIVQMVGHWSSKSIM
jgi:hypothetical protein